MPAHPVSALLSAAALAAVSAVHLFYPKGKNITKALLLPGILVFYIFSAAEVSPVVAAALAAGWLGDVLLMKNGSGWFTAGGISFMLCHILFTVAYLPDIVFRAGVMLPATAAFAVYAFAAYRDIRLIRQFSGKLGPALFLYLMINAAMNVFALMRLISAPGPDTALSFAGAVLFFVSDFFLFIEVYYEKRKFNPFALVMGTYISGVFLITAGLSF